MQDTKATTAAPERADRPARRGDAKSIALVALLVLNTALLVSLLGRHAAPAAHAGTAAQGRASEYMIIPSRPLGMNQDVLYILNVDQGSLGVAGFDQANNRIDFIDPLALRPEVFGR